MLYRKNCVLLLMLFLFQSSSYGQWNLMNGPNSGNIGPIKAEGSLILAMANQYPYLSKDKGATWTPIIDSVIYQMSYAYLINNGQFWFKHFFSPDTGQTWIPRNNGLPGSIRSFQIHNNSIYASVSGYGVYYTTDNGLNWYPDNNGLTDFDIYSFTADYGNLCLGTKTGIFIKSDTSNAWSSFNTIPNDTFFMDIGVNDSNIFVSANECNFYISHDYGNTWNISGLSCVNDLVVKDTVIYAGTRDGFYFSYDNGNSWNQNNTGFPAAQPFGRDVTSLCVDDSSIYAGTMSGFYEFDWNDSIWERTGCPVLRINAMAKMGDCMVACGYNNTLKSLEGGVFLSLDSGLNWKSINNGLPSLDIRCVSSIGTKLIAGNYGGGIYISSDTGQTWYASNNGLPFPAYSKNLLVHSGNVYAVIFNQTYVSYDTCATWNLFVSGIAAIVGNSFYSHTGNAIFMKSDTSNTWILRSTLASCCNEFFGLGNKLFASPIGGGGYVSSDSGLTWVQQTNLPVSNSFMQCGAFDGVNYYTGFWTYPDSAGVYISRDDCNTWQQINDGFYTRIPFSMFINGDHIFVGTNKSVYRRSISEILSTIISDTNFLEDHKLKVYPNPAKDFFLFQLPTESKKVNIEIYNLLGVSVLKAVNTNISEEIKVSIPDLKNGVFIVRVCDGKNYYTAKLIVDKN